MAWLLQQGQSLKVEMICSILFNQICSAMAERTIKWFGIRLTPIQKAEIKRLAHRKGSTQKAAVLNAVERELAEEGEGESIEPQPGSVLKIAQDLCGSVVGPGNLSTNPKHMEEYGRY